jgi:hypothetical protein
MEKAVHPYVAYWAAALVMKLLSDGLWGGFVRCAFWGSMPEIPRQLQRTAHEKRD